ncbi:hypothetical protein RND71_043587 [Anisodus tanguticus]|uniref:Cytosol aminopeptidase domain-containing protein n=1 Tax=Anisodus tanguticus TaxID=243964 RepID=A0AAE1URK1_9SOLA|nr:hypothetical protein RND71_043587 [Anisodus tanguticus]
MEGPIDASFNALEDLDELKENLRSAIGCGFNAIRDLDANVDVVEVDGTSDASAAAEGAFLARYYYDELKSEDLKKKPVTLKLADEDSKKNESWLRGSILAEFQNKCRDLMERPANLLTPTVFCETAKNLCEPLNVKVIAHDRKWAEEKKMGSFLSVANGSDEPPKFLELHYNNSDQKKPIVFVGKGITFDSGGISLKPGSKMDEMRADMGGAANVLTTIACLATLKAKINIIGKATKPGDVVYAMNGKSIQIDNTDAEGRLVLADALCYADTFNPELVVDIATLTGYETGDRVWKMPLYSAYSKKMKDTVLADLNNLCKDAGYGGGSATAAGFLKEFVKCENWMHLDMAGTMGCSDYKYMARGMAGRPLRTLVTFFEKNFS